MPDVPHTPDPPAGPRLHVELPAALTAPGPPDDVACVAATVRELLYAVAAARPHLRDRLLYDGRPLVSVVLNGSVLAPQTALATTLADGDRVVLMPPVAGG